LKVLKYLFWFAVPILNLALTIAFMDITSKVQIKDREHFLHPREVPDPTRLRQLRKNLFIGTTDVIFAMNAISILLITVTIFMVSKLAKQMNRESSVMKLDADGKLNTDQ
jgi:hypothetical protein